MVATGCIDHVHDPLRGNLRGVSTKESDMPFGRARIDAANTAMSIDGAAE